MEVCPKRVCISTVGRLGKEPCGEIHIFLYLFIDTEFLYDQSNSLTHSLSPSLNRLSDLLRGMHLQDQQSFERFLGAKRHPQIIFRSFVLTIHHVRYASFMIVMLAWMSVMLACMIVMLACMSVVIACVIVMLACMSVMLACMIVMLAL